MAVTGLLPWHEPLWARLSERGRTLPHALLIRGIHGIGKLGLALELAGYLLCNSPSSRACGECQPCTLRRANSLPDLHVIGAERTVEQYGEPIVTLSQRYRPDRAKGTKPSAQIRVDQIRRLLDALIGKPQIASSRVAVMPAAEQMNENAANALLKLLEEPPPSTWFVLVCTDTHRLPATIRSRCIDFTQPAPAHDEALSWLKGRDVDNADSLLSLAGGGPLGATELADTVVGSQLNELLDTFCGIVSGEVDPIGGAANWPAEELPFGIRFMQMLVADLARIGTNSQTVRLSFPESQSRLQGLVPQLDLSKVHGLYDRLVRAAAVHDGVLNAQLTYEDLMLAISQLRSVE